ARRVIEADGRVIAPGFVDNHCHYDAQVLWDPLCTFSCHHGATTVIIGNCSLALAPVKKHEREKLAGMLSYVEAIPMDVPQADVLREAGTGVIQCGGGTNPELKDKLLSRLAQACGRQVMYNTLLEQARQPGRWRTHLAHVEETAKQGIRAVPLVNPGSVVNRFTMKNCQVFRSMPTWLPILQGSDA